MAANSSVKAARTRSLGIHRQEDVSRCLGTVKSPICFVGKFVAAWRFRRSEIMKELNKRGF
jgi:hypothetical protein